MDLVVFETGSKQYQVSQGDKLDVELVSGKPGDKVTFDRVLLTKEAETVKIGKPYIAGITVTAKIIDHTKAKKIRIARFRAKSRYRRVVGHRQRLTQVEILGVTRNVAAKKSASQT